MNGLTAYIVSKIEHKFSSDIEEADRDKIKQYAFIVTDSNLFIKVLENRNRFKDCIPLFETFMKKYGLDNFSIGILNQPHVSSRAKRLFSGEWAYSLIKDYLISENKYAGFTMIGNTSVSPKGEHQYIMGNAFGRDCYVNEISFRYFRDHVCYIPSIGKDNPDVWYTRNMIVDLCDGNEQKAEDAFNKLSTGCCDVLL